MPKRSGGNGYIDMLWKGNILIEMKSRGKDLDKAYKQANEYFDGLEDYDLPKYILVCDFQRFRLEDVDNGKVYEFMLDELYKKVNLFGFIAGYSSRVELKEQDPVNLKAAEAMAKLSYTTNLRRLAMMVIILNYILFACSSAYLQMTQPSSIKTSSMTISAPTHQKMGQILHRS